MSLYRYFTDELITIIDSSIIIILLGPHQMALVRTFLTPILLYRLEDVKGIAHQYYHHIFYKWCWIKKLHWFVNQRYYQRQITSWLIICMPFPSKIMSLFWVKHLVIEKNMRQLFSTNLYKSFTNMHTNSVKIYHD